MRVLEKTIIICAIMVGFLCNYAYAGNSLDELIQSHKTPRSVGEWIDWNLWYAEEPEGQDYWQSPQETFDLKSGDCDDAAILAMYILQKHGYKCYILMVWNKNSGHMVCVVTLDDGFCYISSEGYVSVWTKNMLEIPGEVLYDYNDYKYAGWDYVLRRLGNRR